MTCHSSTRPPRPPGEFKFEGVDTLSESASRMWEKAVKPLGIPITANADPALRERLIAAGLFVELDALRFGSHPYLPKVEFAPGMRALADLYAAYPAFGRGRPALEERLRAAGRDYESAIKAMVDEAEDQDPGRMQLDVEAGTATVPSAKLFRELLDHAVRIAQINADVNTPVEPT